VIDLTEAVDVAIGVEDDDDIVVEDVRDLQLLEQLRLDNDDDDSDAPTVSDEYLDMAGTDDDMGMHQMPVMMMIISNTCNIMLSLICISI
jgi:hypothetical protein